LLGEAIKTIGGRMDSYLRRVCLPIFRPWNNRIEDVYFWWYDARSQLADHQEGEGEMATLLLHDLFS